MRLETGMDQAAERSGWTMCTVSAARRQ